MTGYTVGQIGVTPKGPLMQKLMRRKRMEEALQRVRERKLKRLQQIGTLEEAPTNTPMAMARWIAETNNVPWHEVPSRSLSNYIKEVRRDVAYYLFTTMNMTAPQIAPIIKRTDKDVYWLVRSFRKVRAKRLRAMESTLQGDREFIAGIKYRMLAET